MSSPEEIPQEVSSPEEIPQEVSAPEEIPQEVSSPDEIPQEEAKQEEVPTEPVRMDDTAQESAPFAEELTLRTREELMAEIEARLEELASVKEEILELIAEPASDTVEAVVRGRKNGTGTGIDC